MDKKENKGPRIGTDLHGLGRKKNFTRLYSAREGVWIKNAKWREAR